MLNFFLLGLNILGLCFDFWDWGILLGLYDENNGVFGVGINDFEMGFGLLY